MKPYIYFILLLVTIANTAIAQSYELSTLKIGEFKLNMPIHNAEAIANKKLKLPIKENDYNGDNFIDYHGERIVVSISKNYEADQLPDQYIIQSISTQSPKFKTKSGLGIGSTKEDLIQVFKHFQAFTYYTIHNEDLTSPLKESIFNAFDLDAHTMITFKLRNNRVIEITITNNTIEGPMY